MKADALVAGAGFAGATVARRLADAGLRVLVVDPRPHPGGNAFDQSDAHGVLVHRHGPHCFHTSEARVFRFLSRFTRWRRYVHRVLAFAGGRYYPIPVNLDTLSLRFGVELDESGGRALLERLREGGRPERTSEDVFLSRVGRELYETFFRGYTRKQWGREPSELAPAVAVRIPVRADRDDRYFTDRFQAVPKHGYAALFDRMLDHPNIGLSLGSDHAEAVRSVDASHTFYTGSLDAWFGYRLGRLPYRSLRFESVHLPMTDRHQPAAVVNYPGDEPYTRSTEYRIITGQRHTGTTIVREHPASDGPPYYPVPGPESDGMAAGYRALAAAERGVTFLGRLGEYAYLDMDRVVSRALDAAERHLANR
jgi:UDP-galactopyranose mutase